MIGRCVGIQLRNKITIGWVHGSETFNQLSSSTAAIPHKIITDIMQSNAVQLGDEKKNNNICVVMSTKVWQRAKECKRYMSDD